MASQGRCSAMLSVVLLLVSAAAVVQGASYKVGDTYGWTVPGEGTVPANYLTAWVANKTFVAGDILLFSYFAAAHNVLTVNAADYEACNIAAPLLKSTTGSDNLTLAAGTNYYICGVPTHCPAGQKIAVNATASPGTVTPSPPVTAPPPSGAAVTAVTVFQVLSAVTVALVGSLALW